MKVNQVVNPIYNSCSYILSKEVNQQIWLVDIGDFDKIIDILPVNSVVEGVFLTHTHIDHIYGINNLVSRYPNCKIFTSQYGVTSLASAKLNLSFYHEDPIGYSGDNVIILKEGDTIEIFPDTIMEVIETPGHDWSCLSFKVNEYVFTGDSFIPGYRVVTKLKGGDKEANKQSLEKLLSTFTESTIICPGHGNMIQFHDVNQNL